MGAAKGESAILVGDVRLRRRVSESGWFAIEVFLIVVVEMVMVVVVGVPLKLGKGRAG